MKMESDVFRMSRGKFAMTMARLYGTPWIAGAAILAAASAIIGTAHDIRWLIVALMIVMIIAPMALALLYFNHGLKPASVLNILPHSIAADDGCLTIRVFDKMPGEKKCDEEDEEDDKKLPAVTAVREIPTASLKPYHVGMDSIVIPVDGKDGGFLWVPVSAFHSPDGFNAMMDEVNRCIQEHGRKI